MTNKTNPHLTAHMIVKNEEKWIWFSLMSVINLVDEIMVWDTGSTDNTEAIVKSIKNSKIKYKQVGSVDAYGLTKMRNLMVKESKNAEWIFILDGDEVWPSVSIGKSIEVIQKNSNLSCLVNPYINLVGDLYHKLPSSAGRYKIHEFEGDFAIRFINRHIPGLHISGEHGRQTYMDSKGTPIQNYPRSKIGYCDLPYWHMTHLRRSASRNLDQEVPKRGFKFKTEIGEKVPKSVPIPEVFSLKRPDIVSDPWTKSGLKFTILGSVLTPIKKLKRVVYKSNKAGY
jgi:glycosyltransferase involved in cell wall biosynthesis